MCSSAPVSVAERLAHARQLRGFNHAIFTQSRDAQELFNLVRDLRGAHVAPLCRFAWRTPRRHRTAGVNAMTLYEA